MTIDVLTLALRGDSTPLRYVEHPTAQAAVLHEAAQWCLEPLLRRLLLDRGEWSAVPAGLKEAFGAAARRESAFEALRFREARRVLSALGDAGVECLVLKGTALAYTHYPMAYLRPRSDTDLFIRKRDRSLVTDVLNGLNYELSNSVSRDAVHSQCMFKRKEGPFKHVIDLHWAIGNPQLFRGMLSFDELLADATPITPLGMGAKGPGAVHALLLACIHRVAHHDDSPNPLWLYDIKLLAEGLSQSDWDRFWELAAQKEISRLCGEGLAKAQQVGCAAPTTPTSLLHAADACRAEASAAYLGGVGGGVRSLLLDLKGAGGTLARARLLVGHAFPDPTYMRCAYGATGPVALVAAYVRRAILGIWRLIASNAATSMARVR